MTSQWISVPTDDGAEFDAYLSLPPTGTGPGIVLIQEIFGVNAHIRSVADQYASAGYVVLAPDLFWRLQPRFDVGYDEAGFAQGYELMKKFDGAKGVADLSAAVKKLHTMDQLKGKVATVGYCLGGRLAYQLAATGNVDAAVCYYGGGIHQQLDLASQIKCPITFHFGEADAHIPPEAVSAVRDAFAQHANASVYSYPDADHGFNCWARPMYNQHASALALGRSLGLLSKNI